MLSLVSIKNQERSSICSERELNRYVQSEPKKVPRVSNTIPNTKIAALKELLITRRKY